MVYDETETNNTITALEGKIRAKHNDINDAQNIRNQLLSIKQEYDVNNVVITIIDKGTGIAMTQTRKDEIYDACKPLADAVT